MADAAAGDAARLCGEHRRAALCAAIRRGRLPRRGHQSRVRHRPLAFSTAHLLYSSVAYCTDTVLSRSALARRWRGSSEKEEGVDKASRRVVVRVNPAFYRVTDVRFCLSAFCPPSLSVCWCSSTSIQVACDAARRNPSDWWATADP